jgi:ABC-type uncharacterized transport system permease subunit
MKREFLYFLPLAALFMIVVFVPFAFIVSGSLRVNGAFGFDNYARIFSSGAILRSIRNSFSLSLWSSLIGGALGFLFAWCLSRFTGKAREILVAVNTLPLTLSGVVLAYGFLVVFGESGIVNGAFRRLAGGGSAVHVDLLTIGGLVFVYLIFQIPLMTIIVLSAILAMDPHVEEAARSVGAGRLRILLRIVVPQLSPALLAGFFLLFINAFGAYATAYALIGANMNLVTLKIVSQFSDVGYDPGTANALSLLIVVLDTLFVVAYRVSINRSERRAA